ncbi:zinc-ribbon domain-containing protein [Desulfovibrio mangrovi]|uniref:YIP1 family protein n=1 Tax=Desulfovibrio mangrovi TaxID=2976983 RepID=UPI002246C1E8|nr:YIP1 family protein [Desulfovibrio mangrovi]UZP68926.1 zinc-ribbon domain-containing protein [Desulfovibrio mangrovi]
MLIRCPECLFERQVDLAKIPPTAQLATCPKCRFKFRFREYVVDLPEAEPAVEPIAVEDSPYVHPALRDVAEQTQPDTTPVTPVTYVAQVEPEADDVEQDSEESFGDLPDSPDTPDTYEPVAVVEERGDESYGQVVDENRWADDDAYDEEADLAEPAAEHDADRYDDEAVYSPEADAYADEQHAAEEADAAKASASKPHRHLGTISDFEDHGGKGDIWDAIAAMGEGDHSGVSAFIRHSSVEMQIPWENRGKLSLVAAWSETLRQALFSPTHFFSCIQGAGGFAAPLLFFLLTMLLAVGLETGALALLYSLWGDSLHAAGLALPSASPEGVSLGLMAGGLFGVALGRLLVMAVLCHLLLRISFSRCKSFATTFRVIAYSSAAGLAGVLPLVGTIGAQLWFLALVFVGLRHAHEADWKQTILAVLPVCMLILVAVFWMMGLETGAGV